MGFNLKPICVLPCLNTGMEPWHICPPTTVQVKLWILTWSCKHLFTSRRGESSANLFNLLILVLLMLMLYHRMFVFLNVNNLSKSIWFFSSAMSKARAELMSSQFVRRPSVCQDHSLIYALFILGDSLSSLFLIVKGIKPFKLWLPMRLVDPYHGWGSHQCLSMLNRTRPN